MRISDWSSDVCSSDLARSTDRSCEMRQRQRGGEEQAFGDLDSRAMPVARNAADLAHQPPAPEKEDERRGEQRRRHPRRRDESYTPDKPIDRAHGVPETRDRQSTRLNSSQ